jgi:predicted nucleic acid-binding protein
MSGKALIDSNVIIDIAKERLSVAVLSGFEECAISVITYMETLGFPFDNEIERKKIEAILSCFEIVYIDEKIANMTIQIRQSHKIKLPDAIIAATAMVSNQTLITRNTKDFEGIVLSLVNPYS